MATHVPLHEAKAKLSEMVGRAQDHHEEIVITVHGKPTAVLVSAYQFESMQETLDVLRDPETARELLFGEPVDAVDYVAPAGATPEQILSELRSRQEQAAPSIQTSLEQAKAAAAEARHAAKSARKSAARAGARSQALRNAKSGKVRLRARREGRKTADDG